MPDNFENIMFRDFAMYDPDSAEKAINWYEFENLELMIELNDGTKVLYDYSNKSMNYFDPEKMPDEFPEDRWRIHFARRLYKKMLQRGFDQQELSLRTGISINTISKYMNGHSTPSFYNAYKMANALECSVSDFLHFPK